MKEVAKKRGERIRDSLCTRRSFILMIVQMIGILLLATRFHYLQVFRAYRYRMLSDRNRIRTKILYAVRGALIDRDGTSVAFDQPCYVLAVKPCSDHVLQEILGKLARLLPDVPWVENKKLLKVIQEYGHREIRAVLHKGLSWDEVAKVEENLHYFPEIEIINMPERHYPYGEILAHVTGYVAKGAELNQDVHGLSVGRAGLELSMQPLLQGKRGGYQIEVDAIGRKQRVLSLLPSSPGQDIQLSLSAALHLAIDQMIDSEWRGVVLVMEIDSGGIVAAYSRPSYDPNLFAKGMLEKDEWASINAHNTLHNKIVSALYPPGSVFKPIVGLAMLEAGVSPESRVFCGGKMRLGSHIFHCAKKEGHGSINLNAAIAQSCNIYLAQKGIEVGIANIARMAQIFGFGNISGVELPFEVAGLVPDKAWKKRRFGKNWSVGDTVNASIGQGYVLVTPIQLLTMIGRIASGKTISPRMLRATELHKPYLVGEPVVQPLPISERNIDVMRRAMHRYSFSYPGGIVGKTGTAQVISKRDVRKKVHKEHSLFAGYAPYDKPRYGIVTIVENGGWGREAALPLAEKVLLWLRERDAARV